ncbi:MAG: glycoside hydrolase family 15 protein [Acidobacteriota bacterium]|nr:glycoside hydrolase family 15 protein [Acidobacteriota bacterium]
MDKPISDYAMIGDCHGSALVARDGSIDWACLSRFDADPLFCGLLNGDAGGRLETRPAGEFESSRAYLPGTNILQTTFATRSGRVRLTDFLPVGRRRGAGVHDYVTLAAPGWIVRVVEGLDGEVPLLARYRPTHDFGRQRSRLALHHGRIVGHKGATLFSDLPWRLEADGAGCDVTMRRGDVRHLVVAANGSGLGRPSPRAIKRLFNVTGALWSEWLAYSRYDGPAANMVERSALVLKLLTYAPSGAIVAAATSSLPEIPGGPANWDYRFCWLRDGVFLLYALSVLGYSGEAHAFRRFLVRACRASHFDIQIMYGLEAETALDEEVIHGVRGWRGSVPVHRGNGAYQQTQLDVFGEVFEWAAQYHALGGRLDAEMRGMLEELARRVVRIWREPDHGIWERRGACHHYTLGRVMAWVSLDRAIHLLGRNRDLTRECATIRDTVWREAISPDGVLKPAPDIESMDASLLLIGLMGFPCPPGVFARTVARIESELRDGDYVRRFPTDPGSPAEGAFLACSFWLVSAQLLVGRRADAEALFGRLLTRANDVGLYAEEADPASHAFLGNFPQALTHLALIEAAVNLDLCRRDGVDALQGPPAQRARRAVGATAGLRGIWAAFRRAGHVGRLRSSRASTMPTGLDLL